MSDILIRGMEMPESCGECLEVGWQYVFECNLDDVEEGEKLITCPLVSVPPHGDLIDMNAKIDVYDRYDDDIIRQTTVRGLINEYIAGGYPRTILPAKEEKE